MWSRHLCICANSDLPASLGNTLVIWISHTVISFAGLDLSLKRKRSNSSVPIINSLSGLLGPNDTEYTALPGYNSHQTKIWLCFKAKCWRSHSSYSPRIISLSLTLANLLSASQQGNNGGHWEWFQDISFQLNRFVHNETSLGCPDSFFGAASRENKQHLPWVICEGIQGWIQKPKQSQRSVQPFLAPPVYWWWLQSVIRLCVDFVYCHWRWQRSECCLCVLFVVLNGWNPSGLLCFIVVGWGWGLWALLW